MNGPIRDYCTSLLGCVLPLKIDLLPISPAMRGENRYLDGFFA